jgi:hypothetical protein
MHYKVVETSTVTDEEIERILNEWTAKGFVFESIQFVTSVSSKRPTMAFVFFNRKDNCSDEQAEVGWAEADGKRFLG